PPCTQWPCRTPATSLFSTATGQARPGGACAPSSISCSMGQGKMSWRARAATSSPPFGNWRRRSCPFRPAIPRMPHKRGLPMNLLAYFDEPEAGLTSLVGGKGNNLISLSGAGFPVPPGFIITAESYRLFLDNVTGLEQDLASFRYDSPEALRAQCDRLRERLS